MYKELLNDKDYSFLNFQSHITNNFPSFDYLSITNLKLLSVMDYNKPNISNYPLLKISKLILKQKQEF